MLKETKIFEVRDKGTRVIVLVIKAHVNIEMKGYLYSRRNAMLARSGFSDHPLYLYVPLNGKMSSHDPFDWQGSRTHHTAHKYIEDNWDDLIDTQVICVEHILGERDEPKTTEYK